MDNYKELISEVIHNLLEAREIIFSQIVNFAMKNEFDQIHNLFEEGDGYTFHLAHFENSKDANVQKLVELCKYIEKQIFDLIDVNSIDENLFNL